jgi:chromosome condensin MukBEF ATPase and DNA-binding subunit MukB
LNGAGKTTVMIAAYVVLLPDMSRLRFTNLGETGATGGDKGIWGRLGQPGRPSYAVLDFALPAGRLVAGVHLERKGEPSVEPTPFIVSALDEDVRLQDLLLVSQGDHEAVPELPELRENAARFAGRLQSFPSAREYFAALFVQGVTPMRLGTDEERNKLNEMLRTSMTGGISRALTSELRAFLLKEEGGLADTLQRMRANLEACRRTRTEVQESRRLEREIGGVFEAGQTMFWAALLATRARELDNVRAGRREIERLVADGEALLAGHVVWLADDPARQLAGVKRLIAEAEAQLAIHRAESVRHAEAAGALRPRVEGLRVLLGEAALLGPPDYGERVRSAEMDRKAAQAAKDLVAAHGHHVHVVDRHLRDLQRVPLSDEDLALLDARVRHLKTRREQLDAGIEALSYVLANVEALEWAEAPTRFLVRAARLGCKRAAYLAPTVMALESETNYLHFSISAGNLSHHDAIVRARSTHLPT